MTEKIKWKKISCEYVCSTCGYDAGTSEWQRKDHETHGCLGHALKRINDLEEDGANHSRDILVFGLIIIAELIWLVVLTASTAL